MIVCEIKLWPRGSKENERGLAVLCIANVGGDEQTAEYDFWVSHQVGSSYAPRTPLVVSEFAHSGGDHVWTWKTGKVNEFKRARGVVALVKECMKNLRLR